MEYMKKKKVNRYSKKEYYEKYTPLHEEISERVQDLIDEVLPKHLNSCPDCDEGEFVLAENAVSKALCSLSAKIMISSRTFLREPVDFSTTVQLKKNFEAVLQNNINNYNHWYRDEVANKQKETLH